MRKQHEASPGVSDGVTGWNGYVSGLGTFSAGVSEFQPDEPPLALDQI